MLNRLTKFIQSIAKPAATLPDGPVFRSPEHHAYISATLRGAEYSPERSALEFGELFEELTEEELAETGFTDVDEDADDDADWLYKAWIAEHGQQAE